MLYNSLSYLFFFVAVLAAYWAARSHRARLVILLLASWLFYAAWYPKYLLLFVVVTAMTYGSGIWLDAWIERPRHVQRRIVALTVALDLGMLAYFKYAGFLAGSAAAVSRWMGGSLTPPTLHVMLPLGISFYTFQSIAYIVDVYRGDVKVVRNPLKLALFKAFFPQLIAGPIVRAGGFVPQFLSPRAPNPLQFTEGLDLVAMGLIKKVLVADQVSSFADRVFGNADGLSSPVLLLGVYAYAAQIYCDFSGYTDIGRGCAKLLGYELPLNFDSPYRAVNIVDFWRRWHMSLSRWLRDYLYVPLGGSRKGKVRTYVNLLITMLLGGLWHGASWTFVAWGGLHGLALALTRFVHDRLGVRAEQPLLPSRWWRVLSTFITFHLVCVGWVLFRAPTFRVAANILRGVARMSRIGTSDVGMFGWITLSTTALALAAFYTLHFVLPLHRLTETGGRFRAVGRGLLYATVAIALALLSSEGTQQFIYFQF